MAAEIGLTHAGGTAVWPASMRPRRMAAEIASGDGGDGLRAPGFNEAAANGRGNRTRRIPFRPPG